MFFYEHYYIKPYTFSEFWPVGFGGFISLIGSITLNLSLAYGKGGIV
jgi:hypothetical protein